VVADEVRNLAQRCAQAARDTAVLIEESIAKIQRRQNEGGRGGCRHPDHHHGIGQGEDLVEEVNLGGQEQTRGTEQVAQAIVQMQRVTQTSAASAEEAAAAAEELTAQSVAMKEAVDRLAAMVGEDKSDDSRQTRQSGSQTTRPQGPHKVARPAETRRTVLSPAIHDRQSFPLTEEQTR